MKILLQLFILFCSIITLNAQTVTGKLVDHNGNPLSGLKLALHISARIYTATSGTDGSFSFNNITGIVDEGELPTGYEISSNYPNPFNPTTRINVTLPIPGRVKLEVFNVIGQKVVRDTEKYFSAGGNYFDIVLDGLSNGIYFAKITIDEKYSVTRKLMLLYGSNHLLSSGTQTSTQLLNSKLNKTTLDTRLDSIVVTSTIIGKKKFANLPIMTGNSLNLGNLIIERYCPGTPTINYDGKTYNTVQIGIQCWLEENLDVGTMVQVNVDQTNNGTIEKYCYNNDLNNCATYGGLYQWAETVQYTNGATNTSSPNPAFSGNVQGICPPGWHIPTRVEFETLKATVNNNSNSLKAIGQGTGSAVGTNSSGFSALLAGTRFTNGNFYGLGSYAYFWSSTESNSYFAYYMTLWVNDSSIYLDGGIKYYGFSVRCLKD